MDLLVRVRESPAPQRKPKGMACGIRERDTQRKRYRAPGDRFPQADGGRYVLRPVVEWIGVCARFPRRAVRGVVVAVDRLNHSDEVIGIRGTGDDRDTAGAGQANSGAAVTQLVTAEEFGGAKENDGRVCRQAAAWDKVSARRSKRRAWTCRAVTCSGVGAPEASRAARCVRRTSSSVPRSAKSFAKLVWASRRDVRRRAPGPSWFSHSSRARPWS